MFAHIVSADFKEGWDYYSDIAEILYRNGIISTDDKNILMQMSGFRNRLSHEYLGLDLDILTDIVNNRLNDFSKFIVIIKNYCKI